MSMNMIDEEEYLVCDIRNYIYNGNRYWVIARCELGRNNQDEYCAFIRFWFKNEDGHVNIDLGDTEGEACDRLFKIYIDVLSRCDLSTSIRYKTTHAAWPTGTAWVNMLLEIPFYEWYFVNQLISNGNNTLASIMNCFQINNNANNTTYTIDNDYIDRCLQYTSKRILGVNSGMSKEKMHNDYILQRFVTADADQIKYTLSYLADNSVLYYAIPEKLYPICAYVVSDTGEHYENNYQTLFELIIENKIPFNDVFITAEEYLPILEHYIRNIDGVNRTMMIDIIKGACNKDNLGQNISIYERIAQQLLDVRTNLHTH